MFENVLLVTDGSPGAARCAEQCAQLAATLRCHLQILHVTAPLPAVQLAADLIEGGEVERRASERAAECLDSAARIAAGHGVRVSTHHVVDARSAIAIVEEARRHGCHLIVMHGHAGEARSLRNVARDVILEGDTPVMVFP